MDFQPTYRVHLADPLGQVDTPFIITAVYTTPAGHPRAEWFLVVPENKGLLFSQRSRLDQASFPEDLVTLDEELLLSEALDQARLRLRRYLLESKGDAAQPLLAVPTALQASDHTHLVKLWMRGSYCGCLSEIRAKSGCAPLIDALVRIHGLPMLATGDL